MRTAKSMRRSLCGGLVISSAMLLASTVHAQIVGSPDEVALARTGLFTRDANVGVLDRPHPDYAPLGIPLGGFALAPTLDISNEYNDNILAVNTNKTSDDIIHIAPALALVSNWSTNQLTLYGKGNFSQYVSNTSQNTQNGVIGATGRLDVSQSLGLAGGASYEHDTETRTDPNSPLNAAKPVQYNEASLYAVAAKSFTVLRLSARLDVQDFTYQNTSQGNVYSPTGVLTEAAGPVPETYQNHTFIAGTFRAEYAVIPGASVFANLVVDHQQYRDQEVILAEGQPSRTDGGYEMTVGSNFNVSHLVRGEVFFGYLDQSYDKTNGADAQYKDVSGISVRGYVQYYPTQLLTLTLSGARIPVDSVIAGAGAYLDSSVTVEADYELLRNLVLTASGLYENDSYSGINRQDDRNTETMSATYLMNRLVSLNLSYQHLGNDSSGSASGISFNINRVVAGVTLHY